MQLELQVREERELQQQAKPTADEASNNSTCVCVFVCAYIYRVTVRYFFQYKKMFMLF